MNWELNLNTESVELAHPASPLIVEPEASIGEVLRLLRQERRGCVYICRAGELVGLFAERDALKVMVAGGPYDAAIETVMSKVDTALHAHDSIGNAIRRLSFSGQRRLPIVDAGGHPSGSLKVNMILHYLVGYVSKAVYTLPVRPHPATSEREGA